MTPTYEEKLKAVIEAQVKGGYLFYSHILEVDFDVRECGLLEINSTDVFEGTRVLEIILDTQGCKAAYGLEQKFYNFDIAHPHMGQRLEYWHWVCRSIHEQLHSGEGNNYRAAIDTAYGLLNNS